MIQASSLSTLGVIVAAVINEARDTVFIDPDELTPSRAPVHYSGAGLLTRCTEITFISGRSTVCIKALAVSGLRGRLIPVASRRFIPAERLAISTDRRGRRPAPAPFYFVGEKIAGPPNYLIGI